MGKSYMGQQNAWSNFLQKNFTGFRWPLNKGLLQKYLQDTTKEQCYIIDVDTSSFWMSYKQTTNPFSRPRMSHVK